MNIKQLLTDDEAVSPVIGVILMVAITVILAAVIGTFVLGLGDQVSDSAPQASFDYSQSTFSTQDGAAHTATLKSVSITHSGGDSLDTSNIEVTVNGNTAFDIAPSGGATDDPINPVWDSGTITAGSSISIDMYDADGSMDGTESVGYETGGTNVIDAPAAATELAEDDTVRVIWTSSSGGDTATIGKFTIS